MVEQTTQMAPPGWYQPQGEQGERYWDGTQWTDERRPAAEVSETSANAAEAAPAQVEEAAEPLFADELEGPPAGSTLTATIAPDATGSAATAEGRSEATVAEAIGTSTVFNAVTEVRFRRGWPGLFAGENQTKALNRAITAVNASGLAVVATARDRWSFGRRLGSVLLALVTLGFVVRAPNLLLITAPMPPTDARNWS